MNSKVRVEIGFCLPSQVCPVTEARQGVVDWLENTAPERQGEFIEDIELCSNYNSRCSQVHIWRAVAERVEPKRYQIISLEVYTPVNTDPSNRISVCAADRCASRLVPTSQGQRQNYR